MIISIVVAASDNNVIGKDNKLLWDLPNDMAFFKNITWGMPVIVGRKTFESMANILKGRINIVVTRNQDWSADGVTVVGSLDEAVKAAEEADMKECYVIGGGEIYKQALPITDRVYLTRVHTIVDGDTSFPVLDEKDWQLEQARPFPADERHAFSYTFETWIRRK